MPTRPLSTFPCLSFPHVLTKIGHRGRASLWPPPRTPRPWRRHVLSPVECAKSLPDVHAGQPDPPALPPGHRRPPGTPPSPARTRSTEPIPGRTPPAAAPAASPHRGRAGGATGTVSPCPPCHRGLARRGVARGPAPQPRPRCQAGAAGRNGAVRWNLGAGGDGAAGGGRARHVAAYVRRVQGRTAGHRGHRRGDTEPPPRRALGHGPARPRGHGTCVCGDRRHGGRSPAVPRAPRIAAGCRGCPLATLLPAR